MNSCPSPFRFNAEIEECDYPESVPECGGVVGGVECPAERVEFVLNEKSCKKYFICFYGLAFAAECADGTLFDPTSVPAACRRAAEVECDYVKVCTGKPDFEIVPGFTCSQSFICIDGEQYEDNCLPGLAFDPVTKTCEPDPTCG